MPGMGDLRRLEYEQQRAEEERRAAEERRRMAQAIARAATQGAVVGSAPAATAQAWQPPPTPSPAPTVEPRPAPTPQTWPGQFYPPPSPSPTPAPSTQEEFYAGHLRPYEPTDAQALIDYTQRTRYLRPEFVQSAPPINFAHYTNPDYRPDNVLGWYSTPVRNADRSLQVNPDGYIRIVELPGASQVNNYTADTLVHELAHHNDIPSSPPISPQFPWVLGQALDYQYDHPQNRGGLIPEAYIGDLQRNYMLMRQQVPYWGDPAEVYARLATDFSYNPYNLPQELWQYYANMFDIARMPRYPLQPINPNSTPVVPPGRPYALPISTPIPNAMG